MAMWVKKISAYIVLQITIASAFESHYISLKDEEFVGPDKRISELLDKRRDSSAVFSEFAKLELLASLKATPQDSEASAPPPPSSGHLTLQPEDHMLLEMVNSPYADVVLPNFGAAPNLRRQLFGPPRPPPGARPPASKLYNPKDSRHQVKQAQRLALSLAASRASSIGPFMEHNQHDERIRCAQIFGKLDSWLKELKAMYVIGRIKARKRRVLHHIYTYSQMFRRTIDISYTLEFLFEIHRVYKRKLVTKAKPKKVKNEADYYG
ncbi:uncharacterized protein LOC142980026 [Anticarsia gemmatalis]|uniref:uncharacterized protein LOC142980026 n=1 Tax=Anticarsia gemmatalis TaxID=129554 RepID=UPI003F7602D0